MSSLKNNNQCSYIFRSGPLFVGHKFGGASLGQCKKEALESFTVCFDHINKEALWLRIQMLSNNKEKKI